MHGPRDLLERLQGELKFKQTRIETLNFEISRLKGWHFGSSNEPPYPVQFRQQMVLRAGRSATELSREFGPHFTST